MPTRSERRFRRTVKGLWACSYAVSGFERKVLARRAGLDGFSPASSAAVAQQLRVSVKRITRAQRSGVRRLRSANRSQGCAMSSPSAQVEETVGALRAVATAPALVTDGNVTVADAPASPATDEDSQGEVLGARRASTDVHVKRPQLASTLSFTSSDDGSAPWLFILLLSLMAIAASTPLLLRRGKQAGPAPAEPEVPAWLEPEPPEIPAPSEAIAPPPWAEPERTATPKSDAHHGQRRAAGIGLSAVASLALTLLMRARRRR